MDTRTLWQRQHSRPHSPYRNDMAVTFNVNVVVWLLGTFGGLRGMRETQRHGADRAGHSIISRDLIKMTSMSILRSYTNETVTRLEAAFAGASRPAGA